jgi:GNAT superfamily N-acetyltransferase
VSLIPAHIIRQADRHTQAVQAWLASRAPDAVCWRGQGVQVSSTGLHVPLLNLALGGNYPSGTPDAVISGEIARVKAFFTTRDRPWYWWIGPHARPVDLGVRLERHGLTCDRALLPTLVAPLPANGPLPDPRVQVWPASSRADLRAASHIRRVAFRFPDGAALDYFEAMAADWLARDPARLYLARLGDGPPAAIGAWIDGAGMPGVYVMATLPRWGRRGLGKAILARLLADAAAEGHAWIALTASRYGYPLYRQFGFEHVFDYRIYRPAY